MPEDIITMQVARVSNLKSRWHHFFMLLHLLVGVRNIFSGATLVKKNMGRKYFQ